MKLKSLLVAGVLTGSLLGIGAAPAQATPQSPCHYDPVTQTVEFAVCWVYYVTK